MSTFLSGMEKRSSGFRVVPGSTSAGEELKLQKLSGADIPFWKTQSYNARIGTSFAVGAFIFALASVLMFCTLQWPALGNLTNVMFFAGSIPFTIAASLQHFQSANLAYSQEISNSGNQETDIAIIGWFPRNAGWWSTFSQWLGTIAFNISTFYAIAPSEKHLIAKLEIWAPNLEGSILFLVSGYLAFIEVGNKFWSWNPKNLSWNAVFINLLGCIAFMLSALLPAVPDKEHIWWIWTYANIYTLIGAVCFFVSALLLVRESRSASAE